MTNISQNLNHLLQALEPVLNAGVYVFCNVPLHTEFAALKPLAMFREAEGLTLVLDENTAHAADLTVLFRAAWITLCVPSQLQAVGLTAAFSTALAEANISCNVIAAVHHDHIFVPVEAAQAAMTVLQKLQSNALLAN